MNHLAEHFSLGSPVVEPVRSTNGRLVEEVVSTEGERHLVTVTGAAPGRTHEFLARDTISDDLSQGGDGWLKLFFEGRRDRIVSIHLTWRARPIHTPRHDTVGSLLDVKRLVFGLVFGGAMEYRFGQTHT